jgi:hypothetical protein
MSPAGMTPIDWGAIVLAALGLGTAIARVVGRRRAASAPAPTTGPTLPAIPSRVPPAPPGRTDAAITAAEHERAREEAASRQPAAPPDDNAIEPRDLQ